MKSPLSKSACIFLAVGLLMIGIGFVVDSKATAPMRPIAILQQAARAQTGPAIEMEKELEIKTPRLASVTIKSPAKDLWWEIIPAGDFDVFREYDPDPAKIKLRLMPYVDGTFHLIVGGAAGDKSSLGKCKIVVSAFGPGPGPPPPGPGPNPPGPNDPLLLKMQAAYGSNTDPKKAEQKSYLSGIYAGGTKLLADKTFTTWGEIFESMAKAAKDFGVSGKLPELQGVIQVELKANLPTKSDVLLTDQNRKTGIEFFTRIASLLDQVK